MLIVAILVVIIVSIGLLWCIAACDSPSAREDEAQGEWLSKYVEKKSRRNLK